MGIIAKLSQEKALGDIYKVLLIYAFKMWGPNVLPVFFPGEGITIPHFVIVISRH